MNQIDATPLNPPKQRSPLKWAGGKYKLLDKLLAKLPSGGRLIEPFAGSAVVFLNANFRYNSLNDINADLISFYKILKRQGPEFIEFARALFVPENNSEDAYYKLRADFNETVDADYKAALFLYINKHGYNGLIRYNSSGNLNVPFGRYKRPYFPEKELLFFAKKAKTAVFSCVDFEKVMRKAKPGDVVYCDPPYVPLSDTAYFTAYSSGAFGAAEQLRLVAVAREIARQGITVLISNHATKFTREIYSDACTDEFEVRRTISCNGAKREHALEILALYA